MAQITISDLNPIENEFAELSDLELESVVGGKGPLFTDVDRDGHNDKVIFRRNGKLKKIRFGTGRWDNK